MPTQFYCHACKIILIESDVKKWKLLDGNESRYYCPKCDSLLLKICKDCAVGIMQRPEYPTSGDYTKDGFLESFCTKCGHGFLKYLPGQNSNGFSKRKIKRVVDQIFTRQHLPYRGKKALLRELFKECETKTSTVEFLSRKCGEDKAYLHRNL